MDFAREEMKKIKRMYENLNEKYIIEMKGLPPGRLLSTEIKGHTLFQQAISKNGSYKRIGITKDEALISKLARKEFLKKETALLSNNISVMQKAIERVEDIDPTAIIGSMTKAYSKLPPECFFNEDMFTIDHRLKGEERIRMQRHKDWANEQYAQNEAFPENKNKLTSFGLKVRSKSEQLIAERLHAFGVPFRYENIIVVHGNKFAPDFTFQDAEMSLLYWEHAGKMNNPAYEQKHNRKMMLYRDAGIVPWDNLIVTYEKDGILNMEMVDAIIKYEIIPRL